MLTQLINARILTPQGWLKDGSVLIRDGKILEVTNCDLAVIGAQLIDVKGMYVLPGGVEIHAHGGGGRDVYKKNYWNVPKTLSAVRSKPT